uniref:Ovule protein n=1 Tax=Steinernema glaseri TaxID=37863 RepID=A0A1I7YLX9_9BILA
MAIPADSIVKASDHREDIFGLGGLFPLEGPFFTLTHVLWKLFNKQPFSSESLLNSKYCAILSLQMFFLTFCGYLDVAGHSKQSIFEALSTYMSFYLQRFLCISQPTPLIALSHTPIL